MSNGHAYYRDKKTGKLRLREGFIVEDDRIRYAPDLDPRVWEREEESFQTRIEILEGR